MSHASDTTPIRAGELKKGMYAILKGFPCKIIEITTSKTGKHGHAKANITGLDIFTEKKYIDISPTSHNLTQPVVASKNWSIIDIDEDGYYNMMDDDGETLETLKADDICPPSKRDDIKGKIAAALEEGSDVTARVVSAMGKDAIMSIEVASVSE